MAKTTVTATILNQASDPIPGAIVTAKLDRIDAGGGFIMPDFVVAVADGIGFVSMDLWPNEEGVTASAYEITISTPDKSSVERFEAVIPTSVTPVDLYACAALPTYPARDIAYEVQLNAAAAQASEDASALSESNSAASETATAADAIATAADVISTAADAASTAADKIAAEAAKVAAQSSEANAGTSEANALASELKSQKWAEELEDVQVEVGKYSSYHWSQKSSASAAASLVSQNASALSETNSANSEAAALAHKNAAGVSETNSAASEAAALAHKNAAGVSETNSSASESAALASELKSQKWAEELEDVQVEAGKYSAFHWAQKAMAYATGQLVYQGSWDASTGVYPSAPIPVTGHFYKISVAGTILGTVYNIGDSIVYNGAGWDKIDNTELVTSVAGKIGDVTLAIGDIASLQSTLDSKLNLSGGTMTGALTVPSNFTVQKTDDVNEGGEIHLEAPTAWNAAYIDLFQNRLRFRKVGGSNLQYNLDNGDLTVPGSLFVNSSTLQLVSGTNSSLSNYIGNFYFNEYINGGTISLRAYNNVGTLQDLIVAGDNSANTFVRLYSGGAVKMVTNTNGISVTGNVAVTGTVDGRDVAADGTKLDALDAAAAKTADSESITGTWDFTTALTADSLASDKTVSFGTGGTYGPGMLYADGNWAAILRAKTASPGIADFMFANSAGVERMRLAAAGMTLTGNLSLTGTVDGRDVAADGTKLDGIESGATADQTKADIDALSINAYQVGGVQATQIVYGENQSGSRTANPTQTASDIAQYKSGFWDANAAGWTPDTSWWWGMTIAHTSGSPTYLYNAQLAFKNDIVNPEVYLRANGGGGTPSWGSWKKIYHAGNFGKTQIDALNVNADTVDGYHATAYNVFTGNAVVTRHSSGYIFSNYFNQSIASTTSAAASHIPVCTASDGYFRWATPANFFKVIASLTTDASPDAAADYIVTYDGSAGIGKKVLINSLPAPALGAASVARSHLKTTTASGSKSVGSGGTTYTLTGSTYSWWTLGSTNQDSGNILGWGGNNTAAGVIGLCVSDPFSSAGTKTAYFDERYVQASPPYKLDDIVPIFIFAVVDNATRAIESIRVSEDPPWAYHGPTNICADRYDAQGKAYRSEKIHVLDTIQGVKPSVTEQLKNPATRDEAIWRIENESQLVEFEITLDYKNADIDVMPHWWVHNIADGESMAGKTILMLDTTSDLAVHLMEMLHSADATEVRELFDNDYIRFSNSPLARTAPPGVMVVAASWKDTL